MVPEPGVRSLVLASASPRRRDLLQKMGIVFTVMVASLDEDVLAEELVGLPVEEIVRKLALKKAKAVAGSLEKGLVIGADTLVYLEGKILGKPIDEQEAVAMLSRLSGRSHEVYSGVAVVDAGTGQMALAHECTTVTFRHLEQRTIQDYVKTGEPMDKAGAYGIQEKGALLVSGISGCFYNVVGLPLGCLDSLFKEFGFSML